MNSKKEGLGKGIKTLRIIRSFNTTTKVVFFIRNKNEVKATIQ